MDTGKKSTDRRNRSMTYNNKKQDAFHITLLCSDNIAESWQPELHLVFILRGSGKFFHKTVYAVHEGDIFTINELEGQNLRLDENAIALSLVISMDFIASACPDILKYRMNCYSFLYSENQQEPFDILRRDLAKAFQTQYKNDSRHELYLKNKVVAILEDMVRYFLDETQPVNGRGNWEKLKAAITYIQQHYEENITLEDLAGQTYLSSTYLSRLFTKQLGLPFTEYLAQVRLAHAVDLMHGSDTLTEIACKTGFPNSNAMITAFRKAWNITPGEFRKTILIEKNNFAGQKEELLDTEDIFYSLIKYLKEPEPANAPAESVDEITVDMNGKKQKLTQHWKRVINAGYAKDLLDGSRQNEMRYLQEKIGFEYIRIKGVLDDDMCILREDMNRCPVLNYSYIDEVLDLILSVNGRPMLEFSNMPRILARDTSILSMRLSIASYPADVGQWAELIRKLIEHFVQRYGAGQVRRWLFTPCLPPDYIDLGIFSSEEYEQLYLAGYHAVKAVSENFLVCGPGCVDYQKHLRPFLQMCKKKNCLPEILTFHSYASVAADSEENGLNLIENNQSFSYAVSKDEDFLKHAIQKIRDIQNLEGVSQLALVLDEWNSNIWQRDLCNDTCYKSAYLFKNILENNHLLNGMGYFALSDRLAEVPPAGDIFHGGFGLFTRNGIPKSACRAMELLAQIGSRLLKKGDGYFITQNEDDIQIFLYNYNHFDLLYRYRHVPNMSRTSRYQVFVQKEPRAFCIQLLHLPPGRYRIQRYGITRNGGGSYEAWVQMGAPASIDYEELGLLRDLSHPLYRTERTDITGNEDSLLIRESLEPHDVWLIKIKKE